MQAIAQQETAHSVNLYFSQAGSYPLLSSQEETELAKLREQGQTAKRKLLETDGLDTQAQEALAKAVTRGEQAQRRMIECNLRLVIHMARQYSNRGLPFEDLVQEGNIGLMQAVTRYDHRRETRFSTYATWWIKQTILRAIAAQGQVIRLPQWVLDDLRRLKSATARLEARREQSPTPQELAAESGLSVSRIRQLQRWDRRIVSLETPIQADTDYKLSDILPDQNTPPLDETVAHLELCATLYKVMERHLGSKERTYLRVRFGLDGASDQTLKQAAHQLGLTQAHARTIEKRALRQLRLAGSLHEFL